MNRYLDLTRTHFKTMFRAGSTKTAWQKLRMSLLAILAALILSSILISFNNVNPFDYYKALVYGAFNNEDATKRTLTIFAIYVTAAAAIIAGFKAGVFNIGVGGQMVISGSAVAIIGSVSNVPFIYLTIIAILISMATSALLGVLKAFFNVHEVVSAILLNYVLLFIAQYMLSASQGWGYLNNVGALDVPADSKGVMQIADEVYIPALLIALGLVTVLSIIFKFTTLGFALKGTGENKDAAKYAGVKVNKQIIFGMAISGIAAGALGAIYYLGYNTGHVGANDLKSLPSIGFEGISVALIASNSFVGLIPAAFFWGTLSSGAQYTEIIVSDVPREVITLINGFMIYGIAIAIIFVKFKPIRWIYNMIILWKNDNYRKELNKYKAAKKSSQKQFEVAKSEIEAEIAKNKGDQKLQNALSLKLESLKFKYKKSFTSREKEIILLKLKMKYGEEKAQMQRGQLIAKRVEIEKAALRKKASFKRVNKSKKAKYFNTISKMFGQKFRDNIEFRRTQIKRQLINDKDAKFDVKFINRYKITTYWLSFLTKQSLAIFFPSNYFGPIKKVNLDYDTLAEKSIEVERNEMNDLDEKIEELYPSTVAHKSEIVNINGNDSKTIVKNVYKARISKMVSESREKTFVGRYWQKQALAAKHNEKFKSEKNEAMYAYKQEVKELKKQFGNDKTKFLNEKQKAQVKFNTKYDNIVAEEKNEYINNVAVVKVFAKKVGK